MSELSLSSSLSSSANRQSSLLPVVLLNGLLDDPAVASAGAAEVLWMAVKVDVGPVDVSVLVV